MFLTISPKTYNNEWVFFTLTTGGGKLIDAGIVRHRDMSQMDGVKLTDDMDDVLYLTPVLVDDDRLRLANRAMENLGQRDTNEGRKLQWKIRDTVASWMHGNKKFGTPVMCVTTGEQWKSIKDCCTSHKLSYSQLLKHLNNDIGYKTVKGNTYKRIGGIVVNGVVHAHDDKDDFIL